MAKNARAFRFTVGMSLQQFDKGRRKDIRRLDRPGRRCQVGAGRPFALHLWDRVLTMYYRKQDGMTHLFGISQGRIGKIAPTIWECLLVTSTERN